MNEDYRQEQHETEEGALDVAYDPATPPPVDDDDDSALGCITSIAVFWNNKATPEDWHYRVTFDGHAPETGPYAAMPLVCRDIHTCLADAVVELGVYWGVAITPGMVAVDLDHGGFAEWSTN